MMVNINGNTTNGVNYLYRNSQESIEYAMAQEPFYRWVLENTKPLNQELIQMTAVNLSPFKSTGRKFIKKIIEKHTYIEEVLENAVPQMLPREPISYSSMKNYGYTGPIEPGDPVTSTLERLNDIRFKNRGISSNAKGILKLNANIFAKYVLTRIYLVREGARGAYIYEKTGRYKPLNDELLKKLCRNILHEAKEDIWTVKWENEYFTAVKREMHIIESLNPHPQFINLRNGMLDLNSLKLRKHSSRYYSTIQLNIEYDPEAKCPQFRAFLHEIFEKDRELIKLIQEVMGYCFLQEIKLQNAFIFLGSGSNGKSVLADVIRHLIGPENVSSVSLSGLNSKFGMQDLPGKLVNISTENELDKKFNTQNFKALTGDDAVNVEKKYQDSYNTKLFAKIIILLNRMIESNDHSEGYYRRLVIIPFNKSYRAVGIGETRIPGVDYMDKNLKEKLLQELDGILNFALIGLHRLIKNDFNMTRSKASEKALYDYKVKQNPVIEFLSQKVEWDINAKTKRSELRRVFMRWATANGFEENAHISSTKFLELFDKAMAAYKPSTKISIKKIQGTIYLAGIRVKGEIAQEDSLLDEEP
ncbi:phage/plasmid primase, P4 family [Planococcus sp. APC 3900]|uniref:DNA primase family protein n=1 Tax=Planococcus sp. APC 3900 TaxID=3035191 RepID=UPI0025B3D4BE|nr:DNA primase family protein [Planococcus sp. APC 3900]MDN3436502.1 phage/plasmid primase, P4 family [Planococcus sp. APC 3900]